MAKKRRKTAKSAGEVSVTPPTSVDIFYEKSQTHRTVYADGAFVGTTPALELQVSFFKNLTPVPEYVRQEITEQDSLGRELDQARKLGIIREYETTVILSRETSEAIMGLMRRILDQTKNINKPE